MSRKKTAAQLDREIAAALAAGPPVKISVHEVQADEEDNDDNNDDNDDRYMISDDGGEFDDSEETYAPEVQGDIDDRREPRALPRAGPQGRARRARERLAMTRRASSGRL